MSRSKTVLERSWARPSVHRERVRGWVALLAPVLAVACSSSEGGPATTGGSTATGGIPGAGSGGTTGGVATAGRGGVSTATGGSSGGTPGTPTGGATSGGAGTGGASTGGTSTTGGSATGGTSSTTGGSSGGQTGGTSAAGSGGAIVSGGMGGSAGGGAGGKAAGGAGAGGGSAGGGSAGYQPCPTTPGTPCAVLPLGDSITEGCCKQPAGGYRIELFRRAVQNKKNLTFVGTLVNGPMSVDNVMFPRSHQGHGGYTIDTDSGHNGISGQITDRALSMFKPHIVLLMIGTNDINGNVDVANAPKRLGALIDDITTGAPDALVVVATIIPTTNDGTNQRFKTYNAAIPELVSTRAAAGKHVVLLDNYAAFERNNYKTALMADSLHPNDAGYVVLGTEFYGVIGNLLPAAP